MSNFSLFVILLIIFNHCTLKCKASQYDPDESNDALCKVPKIKNGELIVPTGKVQYAPGYPPPNFPVIAVCNEKYVLNTTYSVVYCVNGKFETALPKCISACPPIISTSVNTQCQLNGTTQDCSKKVPEGTIATMKCKANSMDLNPNTLTAKCLGGFWDKPQKQCIMLCPAINTTSVDAECTLKGIKQDCSKQVFEGTIAKMKCKSNFLELKPSPSTAICLGGSWNETLKLCLRPRAFSRCELAEALLSQGLPRNQLENWVCLVEAVSGRNTSNLVGPYQIENEEEYDYGIFGISGYYWCKNGSAGGSCKIDCNKLIDDDITDDTKCAKLIYKEGGFSAWRLWFKCEEIEALPNLSECGV